MKEQVTTIEPGLYHVNMRGATIGECWRLGKTFTGFLLGLYYKYIGENMGYTWFPPSEIRRECSFDELGSVTREKLAPLIEQAKTFGYPKYNAFVGSPDQPPLVNIGYGQDVTIKELAEIVAGVVGFKGQIVWDGSKPDGTPRKLMDSSRIFGLGWRPTVKLQDGIKLAYQDFLARKETFKD
jgi:hypothetical protein